MVLQQIVGSSVLDVLPQSELVTSAVSRHNRQSQESFVIFSGWMNSSLTMNFQQQIGSQETQQVWYV